MKRFLAIALPLMGCTTISGLRQDVPQGSYSSARSAAALEECLAGSLSWIGAPSIVHGETATELAFGRGFGDSFLLVSLRPSGSRTSVEVQEQDRYGGKVRRSVESCI